MNFDFDFDVLWKRSATAHGIAGLAPCVAAFFVICLIGWKGGPGLLDPMLYSPLHRENMKS